MLARWRRELTAIETAYLVYDAVTINELTRQAARLLPVPSAPSACARRSVGCASPPQPSWERRRLTVFPRSAERCINIRLSAAINLAECTGNSQQRQNMRWSINT